MTTHIQQHFRLNLTLLTANARAYAADKVAVYKHQTSAAKVKNTDILIILFFMF